MESTQASRHMSSHQHEEAVREVEQVRHTNETLHQDNPSSTYRAQTEASNIRIVTPNYKTGEKPSSDLRTGVDAAELNAKFSETNGDYKAERSQEHFRMQIIDPKVNSNAHLPAHAPREYARKKLMDDFPSLHGKRSFLNLDSMEQRRVRGMSYGSGEFRVGAAETALYDNPQQSRPPITTSKYLTESVDRHRDMEASELSKYLKAREEDANKPWNKPGWPGPKNNNVDLDQLRQSLDALQKSSLWRTKSLGDLRADPPDLLLLWGQPGGKNVQQQQQVNSGTFEKREATEEQILGDPGYLVKVRKNRYLSKAARTHSNLCYSKPYSQPRLQIYQRTQSESQLLQDPIQPKAVVLCEDEVKEEYVRERRSIGSTAASQEQECCYSIAAVHSNLPTSTGHIPNLKTSARPADRPVRPPRRSTTNNPYRQRTLSFVQQSPEISTREAEKPTSIQSTTLFHSLPRDRGPHQHIYVNTSQPQKHTSAVRPTATILVPDTTTVAMSSVAGQTSHDPQGAQTSHIPPKSILKHNFVYKQELEEGGQYWQDNAELGHSSKGGHRSLLDNPEYQRQMAENLQAHRQRRGVEAQPQQSLPFNGPFFRLEEVAVVRSGPSDEQLNQQRQQRYQEEVMRPRSASSAEQSTSHQEYSRTEETDDEGVVVIWPPLDYNTKRPTFTPVAKNMRDPETIQEFQRQRQMELEAIQQNEEREMRLREKQFQAAKVQQEQLLQRQQQSGTVPNESVYLYQSSSTTGSQPAKSGYGQAPLSNPGQQTCLSSPNLRVFEARPISAFSGDSGLPIDATFSTLGSAAPSWKRTYTVENIKDTEKLKNEILTSDEVLQKERFEIDLLRRREAFVEKIEPPPQIKRLGRRWQAPPEKPYVWPTLRRPVTIQTPSNEFAYNNQASYNTADQQEGYQWTPVVRDPGYKHERKNFTPTHSPPEPSRSGTLDEVAKRQTRHVIQPSPDGSHRPKPAFRHGRQTPSGGFFPHAPNAIKVIKKRNTQISKGISPDTVNEERSDVQIIHKLDYHSTGNAGSIYQENRKTPPYSRENSPGLNEWEKIYDLPPHSSTLTDKAANAVPRIDVKKRMRAFQHQPQQISPLSRRSRSISGPDLSQLHLDETERPRSQLSPSAQKGLERLRSGQSSPAPASYEKARRYVPPALPPGYRPSRRTNQKQAEIPVAQPTGHTKRMAQVVQSVAASHHYNKEPLAAHKLGSSPSPRQQQTRPASSTSVHFSNTNGRLSPSRSHSEFGSPGNLPSRVAARSQPMSSETGSCRTSSRSAPPQIKTAELDELSKLSKQLAERSKSQRADYHLSEVESIIKSVPEPLPTRLKEQNRETMESRTSNGTSFNSSAIYRDYQDRSEYVTDTSSWQFNQSPFSPRSVISMNGVGRNGSYSALKSEEGLLKVRTSMYQDQKQQHQRRHSSSRLAKEPVRREVVEVRREQVASKPKVTQTVQRFEEKKRTEEVERRVIRRERRHKSHRTRYGHGYQQEYDYHSGGGGGGYRSTSASRGGAFNNNGYVHPITYESHHTSSRRGGGGEHERSSAASDLYQQHNRGMAHARYGSLSDSLRRGELKYIPNGELREANGQNAYSKHTKVHKSHSTRDVFGGHSGGGNYGSHYSFNNRHGNFEQPLVEFPPTLPRGGRYGSHLDAPVPPPHLNNGVRGGDDYRPLTKSRSYADWDQGRGPFGNSASRYDEDMARLENEFRDSHLIRVPNGNMNEKEYRHQEIPGGYESYSRDTKANGGRKINRDGLPTDFKESTQEYNFKREQQR